MRRGYRLFDGSVVLELRGAAGSMALSRLARERVAFWNVEWIDELTLRLTVFSSQKNEALKLIAASMCDGFVTEEIGMGKKLAELRHRVVLLLLVCLALISAVVLPRFVFFYEVIGNDTVPAEEILRELRMHGIGFGTYGPDIHPLWVKNHMIDAIPKLQWLTITQNGCRAKVIVRERPDIPETENRKGFSNVVASQNGMITKMSVFAGQPAVKTGDIVEKGQLLVSGIVDLERIYVLENANAEIFARTWREITACIPENYQEKDYSDGTELEISLQIGQKRIKLIGNSGISHGSCDKMIKRYDLTLPGGLDIPVSLEFTQYAPYDTNTVVMSEDEAMRILSSLTEARVKSSLQAGELLAASYRMGREDGKLVMYAVLECHEMIAERVSGKITFEE